MSRRGVGSPWGSFWGGLWVLFLIGCNNGVLLKDLGSHLAAPIAMAVDAANARAYVVNSNNRDEFDGASLSILDITDPTAPTLLPSAANPISIPDYSGKIYFDAATKTGYVPNRLSDNTLDRQDTLLRINLDETSASFGAVDTFIGGDSPFGIACCDASGRIYAVSNGGTLEVYSPADLSTSVQISFAMTLSSGEPVTGRNATEAVLLGDQAFVTNRGGRIFVINTTEVGNTSLNPIDYIVLNGGDLRGIATDGTLLYVVSGTSSAPVLRTLNPASLTPISPDASAASEVDISALQSTSVAIGTDPYEVAVFNGHAYVSNRGSDSVSDIDLTSGTVAATISVGDEPFGLAPFTMNGGNYLYVTNLVSNSISIIDLASNTVVNTLSP